MILKIYCDKWFYNHKCLETYVSVNIGDCVFDTFCDGMVVIVNNDPLYVKVDKENIKLKKGKHGEFIYQARIKDGLEGIIKCVGQSIIQNRSEYSRYQNMMMVSKVIARRLLCDATNVKTVNALSDVCSSDIPNQCDITEDFGELNNFRDILNGILSETVPLSNQQTSR